MSATSGPRELSLFDGAMAAGGMELVTGTPTVISAAVYFETLPSKANLEALVRDKMLAFDVCAGRPEFGRWQPVGATFDLGRHLLFHQVSSESDLALFVQNTSAKPLLNKGEGPWWEMHAVSTRDPMARELIFFRIEHACADGIALLQLLSHLVTTSDGSPLPVAEYRRPPSPIANPCALLCGFLRSFLKYAIAPIGSFDTQLPVHPPLEARHAGLHFSSQRRLVVVPEHSLEAIKTIKTKIGNGVTVNDVVYAAFAGAIRRHCRAVLEANSSSLSPLDDGSCCVRALVPIAFPRRADSPLTNDWTFLSVPMPVGVAKTTDRVAVAHETFAELKASPEAAAARLAVQINSCSPPSMLGAVGQQLFSRHTLVFSNVPGPSQPVYIGGQRVIGIFSAFPNLITQVLCLSYDGRMFMTIACDERVPEPERLAEFYLDELRELGAAYGLQPGAWHTKGKQSGVLPGEYTVEAIIRARGTGRKRRFLVHWEGYGEKDRTWECAANLHPQLVADFEELAAREPHLSTPEVPDPEIEAALAAPPPVGASGSEAPEPERVAPAPAASEVLLERVL